VATKGHNSTLDVIHASFAHKVN